MCSSSIQLEAGVSLSDSALSGAGGGTGKNFTPWASEKFLMAAMSKEKTIIISEYFAFKMMFW